MTLANLSKKIQQTRLFSDAQKVDLLVKLNEASAEDVKKLEAGIDVFDREYKEAIDKRSKEILELLASLLKDMSAEEKKKHQEAIDEMVMGMALLQPQVN